jgi:hypothetical protein
MTMEVLTDAGRRVIAAWARYDRLEAELRRRYLVDKPRAVDREAFEQALADAVQRRDSEIATIRAVASAENAADEASIRQRLGRDLGKPQDSAIASAWARLRPMLDNGFPIEELFAVPGFNREAVEALRANYPSYVAAKVGPSATRDASIRESVDEAMRRLDAAEIGMLDGDVGAATVEARQRDGAEAAMRRAMRYDAERRESKVPMPLDAKTELGLAYGLASDLGQPAHVPGARTWDSIIAEIDPEAQAQAERNSLRPELRDALDGNARDVGFGVAEPSLKVGEGR